MNNVVVGIDTDTKGAVSVLDWDAGTLDVYKFPFHTVRISNSNRKRLLESDTASLLKAIIETRKPRLVVLEEQWARPKQGVTSAFTFGDVSGFLRGCCLGADPGLAYEMVTGSVWKAAFGLTRSALGLPPGDKSKPLLKAAARDYAAALFPNHGPFWPSEPTTSSAEASLIALYGLLRLLNYKPATKQIAPSGTGGFVGGVSEITKAGPVDGKRSKRTRRSAAVKSEAAEQEG